MSARKPTPRQVVLQRYPHAYVYKWADRSWTVYAAKASDHGAPAPHVGLYLGSGATSADAWVSALNGLQA